MTANTARTVLAVPSGCSSITGGCPTLVRNNRTIVHSSQMGEPCHMNEPIARHATDREVPIDTHLCIGRPVMA